MMCPDGVVRRRGRTSKLQRQQMLCRYAGRIMHVAQERAKARLPSSTTARSRYFRAGNRRFVVHKAKTDDGLIGFVVIERPDSFPLQRETRRFSKSARSFHAGRASGPLGRSCQGQVSEQSDEDPQIRLKNDHKYLYCMQFAAAAAAAMPVSGRLKIEIFVVRSVGCEILNGASAGWHKLCGSGSEVEPKGPGGI